MTSINDLPTEILLQIFELLFSFSPKISTDWNSRPGYELPFNEIRGHEATYDSTMTATQGAWSYFENYRNPGLFPFNLSSVCTRWHGILACSPNYWTLVVFDVGSEQYLHQLNSLLLRVDHDIMVYVFTSVYETTEEEKARENSRTAAIVEHLIPHIGRCTSIVFQISFASSLPPPILFLGADGPPKLEELRLDCRVYDGTGSQIMQPFDDICSFLPLQKLSLTGSAFMDLAKNGLSWLLCRFPPYLTLEILHLQLGEEQHERTSGPNSLKTLMLLLGLISPIRSIYFREINLGYRPRKRRNMDRSFILETENIYFHNVSKGFLTELFNSTTISVATATFIGCNIPRVRGYLDGELELISIPADDSPALPDQSLRNILSIWTGNDLRILTCSTFTNETLGWMGMRNTPTALESLHLYDSANFTPIGIRHLLGVQSAYSAHRSNPWTSTIHDLCVVGDVPALEEDDVEWFERWLRDTGNGRKFVEWQVSEEEQRRMSALDTYKHAIFEFPQL